MPSPTNYYAILGLAKNAGLEEIKRAYWEAARRYHPDVNTKLGETELFLDVKAAYDVLSDPKKKAEYDALIDAEPDVYPASIEVLFSRSSLPRSKNHQLLYALLRVIPNADAIAADASALNVCLVIDRSTSMQGERMDTVKDAAIELIRNLKPSDTLSIVTFSDYAEVLLPAGRGQDRNALETSIRLLHAKGGTEIYRGMEAGFAEVRRNIRPTSIDHMILITDGRTYGDEQACLGLADKAASLGIGISGLGIGNEWNDAFLDELATRSGGSSIYVSDTADIDRFLKQKFQELSQVYAESVVYYPEINPSVTLNYAFRLKPQAGILGTEPPLRLGNLPKDSNLEILLEFLVGPISPAVEHLLLAEGRFTLGIPSRPMPTFNSRLSLGLPIRQTFQVENPPAAILWALKQLTLYRIQEKAQEDIAAGEVSSANRRLKHLASHLLAQGESSLARTVFEEIENLERDQSLTETGGKRIKYGTRALFQSNHT